MADGHGTESDFPEYSWLLVRVTEGDVPRAIRMRRFLKAIGRRLGIVVERMSGIGPNGERADASKTANA